MNQKDYKEIAGIIKDDIVDIATVGSESRKVVRIDIINKLANYFEREAKKTLDTKNEKLWLKNKKPIKETDFNKATFLKDCGVK